MYRTARTTPLSRAFLVAEAERIGPSRAARNMGVSRRTVQRWRRRAPDFADRPCRPHHSPRRSSAALEATVLTLRIEQRWGPDRIGAILGLAPSSVHRILRRHDAHRLSHLFPKPPRSFGRFAVTTPGELVAIDTKRLGSLDRGGGRYRQMHHSAAGAMRKVGWRHLHVAIDFASRLVFTQLRASDRPEDTMPFLDAALRYFDSQGIRVRRILTDNGNGYLRRYREHAQGHGIRHSHTQPYHPWTNGRVERFNGTIQRECLYASHFTEEAERDLAVALFVAYYNAERPHIALGGLPPLEWLRRNATYVPGDLS